MKKLLTILLVAMTLFVPVSAIYAQEETIDQSETLAGKNFDLEIYPGTQSIFNKTVPVYVKIKANITTDKLQIRWTIPQGLSQESTTQTVWGTINAGEEVIAETKVLAEYPGSYRVSAEVQAWKANANYIDTSALDITFDQNGEIYPQTDQYKENQRTWFFAKIGIIAAMVLGLIIGIVFGYQKFKEWLEAD